MLSTILCKFPHSCVVFFPQSFNYMVMTWTPTPEFALVCLKNVLRSTFQMFFISIQFNYNSSEIYPQDIDVRLYSGYKGSTH